MSVGKKKNSNASKGISTTKRSLYFSFIVIFQLKLFQKFVIVSFSSLFALLVSEARQNTVYQALRYDLLNWFWF